MVILNDTTEIQSFKIIPRYYPASVIISVTDTQLNTSSSYDITPTYSYSSMIISQSFSLTENHFYKLEVFDSGSNVFRGSIFCTNQTNYNKFDITSGSFKTSDDVDNIILI